MKIYQIVFSKAVRKQIQNLPGHVRTMAKREIANLSENPRPGPDKELTGQPDYFRIWILADYRLVWHVMDDEQTVEIEYVGPKTPDLYEHLGLARPRDQG